MDTAKLITLLTQVQTDLAGTQAKVAAVLAELAPVPAPAPPPVPTPAPTPKPVGRVPENPAGTVPGLEYTYHEGNYNKLPDFNKERVVTSGFVPQPTLSIRKRDEGWAQRDSGYVLALNDGEHTFFLASDDGSRLLIGNQVVVLNDAVQGTTEKSGKILLQKGLHAITIEYFNYGGPQELVVSYAGPGIAKQVIPASAYFRIGKAKVVATNVTAQVV